MSNMNKNKIETTIKQCFFLKIILKTKKTIDNITIYYYYYYCHNITITIIVGI
jgi:hypothetical protein